MVSDLRTTSSIEARLVRLEARLDIQELAARYARAVDSRDIDGLVGLFTRDVNCGALGRGRAALSTSFAERLSNFYRSVHQLCGHAIDFESDDKAVGTVYCRAEHEVGDRWIIEALCYFDTYARDEEGWRFARRKVRAWYATDWQQKPGDGGFRAWPGDAIADLPQAFQTWSDFWNAAAPGRESELSRAPTRDPST